MYWPETQDTEGFAGFAYGVESWWVAWQVFFSVTDNLPSHILT
jgi:hypothetical protein